MARSERRKVKAAEPPVAQDTARKPKAPGGKLGRSVKEQQDRVSNQPKAEEKGGQRKKRTRAAPSADQLSEAAPPRLDAQGVPRGSKQAILVEQLSRPSGARITDLVSLLGWQPHTVRAALTGLRRKGYAITRCRNQQDETVYRASPRGAEAGNAKAVERA